MATLSLSFALSAETIARRPRVLSYGGGLDSWAMLLEAVLRGDRPDVAVFVDVGHPGDPGEWPSTYRHIREVVMPFCKAHAIEFVWITSDQYPVRNARSLFAWMYERGQIPIANSKQRVCTTVAKVERFERWMDDRFPGREVEVWVGFDAAEPGRADNDPNLGNPRKAPGMRPIGKAQPLTELRNALLWTRALAFAMSHAQRVNRYPLIEWGLCRCRCEATARASGMPVPRKSACVFCPYATRKDFQALAAEAPDLFAAVVDLEARKPPTSNGYKLSIKAFDKRRKSGQADTPLPVYIAQTDRSEPEACSVCGAAARATKATGCTFLAEAA